MQQPYRTIDSALDYGYMQKYGWGETTLDRPEYLSLWNKDRLAGIQRKITQLLEGVDPEGRPILVPLETIGTILTQVFQSNTPLIGDMYSRYTQLDTVEGRDDVREIIDRTINIIVGQIRNEYEAIAMNKRLTVWTSVLGDFNAHGLRSHSMIKLRHKRPQPMMFNMNF